VLDIGRFIRHVPRGDRERGEIEPAFTSEDFVIAYDSRGGCFSLNWHADGDNHKLDIDPGKWIVDEMIEIRQRKSIYKVERNDLTFELWAERKMRNAAAAPPPLR
jgi:hypothetical protein